ncbi:unnamed protein product [Clonostachys rhizophaga]|uniref:Uncharacterized protein n=1 Tax=Clonostachys rhizophaga TaxID=160324 RepID=A0A9N9VLK3_9HYPO|nr:unnamed protein product [Clonostachys rhizophaga]
MRSNVLLIATALASTAMATSYNYARGLDADYPELEERDASSSEEEAAHFLRNIDDDELNALYVRGRGITAHKKPSASAKPPKSAKPNNRFKNFAKDKLGAKTLRSFLPGKKTRRNIFKDILNVHKTKPSLPTKPSGAILDSRRKKLFGSPLSGIKNASRKKTRRGFITDAVNARNKKPSLPTKPSHAKPDSRRKIQFANSRRKKLFGDSLSGIRNASRKKNRRSMSGNIGGKKQRLRGPGTAAARLQRQAMNTKLLAGTPKKIPRRG